jgi:tetrahydromethanopterin S-methyltransferase subunit C
MAGKNTAVFGIYKTRTAAEAAVDELISAGFPSADVSVLLPDVQSTREVAHEKSTKAPEGTTTGVAAGGAVGGTLGLLAGIGALAIPGLGPFIAAGPIMGALAGAGAGGAVGGIVGALVGMGIPEYEAKRYEGHVKNGGILLSVHCDTSEEVSRAKDILKNTGAADISSTGEASADTKANRSDRPVRKATN